MKKKILLSAFTMFGIMIAGNTFAQYHKTVYVKNNHKVVITKDVHSKVRDIQHDQANINYDLRRIEAKKAEISRDLRFRNMTEYHKDRAGLQKLYRILAEDRRDLAFDMKDIHTDRRVAIRY
ncbi:MAG TPA: hypothetical protein VHB48_00570 [Chitinophagaceae bacterium]|nr:hypothetical protein [Chitinophagaceae bacterium]